MSAPPHFNPAESLLPDVKASIGGVQGGGGGQTTFLKDILIALKGSTIQYKNPNDSAPKSYVVGEILGVSSVPEETKAEPKKAEEPIQETTPLDLQSYQTTAYRQIGALKIANNTKRVLKDAVAYAENVVDIQGLLGALNKINITKVPLINVSAAVATEAGPKKNIIKAIIQELDK
jgi:hypothetical protein